MTVLARGMHTAVGFAQEAVFGTFLPSTNFLRVVGVTPNNKTVSAVDPVLSEEMDEEVYFMQNEGGLDLVVRNNYEGEELLWHSLLGTYNYSVGTGAEYNHGFIYDPSDTHDFLTGLSIYASFFNETGALNASARALKGAHVTRAVIEGNANDFLRTTFTLFGQQISIQDAAAPTFPERLPVLGPRSTVFTLGNTAVKSSDWRITIDVPRAEGRFHYGAQKAAEAVRVDRIRASIEATVELDMTSNAGWALLNQFTNAPATVPTRQNLIITHTTVGLVDATAPYSMAIIGDFYVTGDEPSVQDPGIVTFNMRGTLVNDGTNALTVTFHNGVLGQVT